MGQWGGRCVAGCRLTRAPRCRGALLPPPIRQNAEKLYLVTDFAAGGELFFWLKKDKRFSKVGAALTMFI